MTSPLLLSFACAVVFCILLIQFVPNHVAFAELEPGAVDGAVLSQRGMSDLEEQGGHDGPPLLHRSEGKSLQPDSDTMSPQQVT